MSSYFVAQIKVNDACEYRKYLESCDEIFKRYNGRYLAVDEDPAVIEGAWGYSRIVIIRFDNDSELYRWYHSDDYQRILRYRLNGAQCDTLVVRGTDGE